MDLSKGYNQKISNIHLVEITGAHCTKWRLLPPLLGLESTVKDDINRKSCDEREKRYDFLTEWKQQKGAGATYRALINALQKIGCQSDAEYVSQLILPLPPTSGENHSTVPTPAETKNDKAETSNTASNSNTAGIMI